MGGGLDEERRAIVEVEVVTEKLGGAAYQYLLDVQGQPLGKILQLETDRRLREMGSGTEGER